MSRRFIWKCGAGVALLTLTGFALADGKDQPKKNIVIAPLSADVVSEAHRAEQDAVIRRLDVCDKLRKLGIETNNSVLIQQADELLKQVTTVYNARVARLGVKSSNKILDTETTTMNSPAVVPAAPEKRGSN